MDHMLRGSSQTTFLKKENSLKKDLSMWDNLKIIILMETEIRLTLKTDINFRVYI